MKARFLADNDLRGAIRKGVIRLESLVDFQSAKDAQLDGLPDPQVLRLAMEAGRILVSHDVNSMPGHFKSFLAEGNDSPGLFLIPQETQNIKAVESLSLIWAASDAEEWRNRIVWLPL